jgi:RNA polymerase primary sigma factor
MLKILREFDHPEEYQSRDKLREVACSQKLSADKVEKLLQHAKPDVSIDAPLSAENDDLSLSSLLTAQEADLESIVITPQTLNKYLTRLSDSHRIAITLRFGLNHGEPQSFREIGKVLGRSAERCRQMTQEALDTLKSLMTQ